MNTNNLMQPVEQAELCSVSGGFALPMPMDPWFIFALLARTK